MIEKATNVWGIRLRPRAGFGWGEPALAAPTLFAWEEKLPSIVGVAFFRNHREAERRAKRVRSRKLAARPVRLAISLEARL